MKNRNIYYMLLCLVLLLSPVSCRKNGGGESGGEEPGPEVPVDPEKPLEPGEFRLDFISRDGTRDLTHVLSEAVMNITLRSSDKDALYNFVYSVNGGVKKYVRDLKDGINKTINFDFKDFGKYTIKGYAYDPTEEDNKYEVEADIWMKYDPATVSSVQAVTLNRTITIGEEGTFFEKEEGSVELAYSPRNTFLNVTCSSSDSEIFKLDQATASNYDGVYKIGFKALKIGKTTIDFELTNGPDKESISFPVEVREDTEGLAVYATLSVETDLAFQGLPLEIKLDAKAGDVNRRFNIDYLIDGSVVETDESVMLSGDVRKTIDVSKYAVGLHKISAKITAVDGRGTPVECEENFYVAAPGLDIDGITYSIDAAAANPQIKLAVGTDYSISITGIPEGFENRFLFIYDKDNYTVTGNGPWSLNPSIYGKGEIGIKYSYQGTDKQLMSINVLRTDVFPITLSWSYVLEKENEQYKIKDCTLKMKTTGRYATTVPIKATGSVSYHGYCEYPVPSRPQKEGDYVNTMETASTQNEEREFSRTTLPPAQVITLANLEDVASDIISKFFECEYWTNHSIEEHHVVYDVDLGDLAFLVMEDFHYRFIIDRFYFGIDTDIEGLSYELTLDGVLKNNLSITTDNITLK